MVVVVAGVDGCRLCCARGARRSSCGSGIKIGRKPRDQRRKTKLSKRHLATEKTRANENESANEKRIKNRLAGTATAETENENTDTSAHDPVHLAARDSTRCTTTTCNTHLFNYELNGYTGPELDVIPSTLYCFPIPSGSITLCAPLMIRSRFSSSLTPSRSFWSRTRAPMLVRKVCWVMGPWVAAAIYVLGMKRR